MSNYNFAKLKKEIKTTGALLLCALIFSGCKNPVQDAGVNDMKSESFFAMDTVMEIQINGDEQLLKEAQKNVEDLEKQLSVTEESSEVSKINSDNIGRLTGDGAKIFEGGMEICKSTGGALDLTIYPVLKAWGFTTGDYRVPADEDINNLLKLVDYKKVEISNQGDDFIDVVLPEGMEIDLGSITKGYTSQMLHDYFKENGVKSALINLGGNVQCVGTKPDGSPWKIAIKSPFQDSNTGIIGILEAKETAIVTSGGYERFFETGGETYWHILNPDTGYPARNGLVSVSIVGKDGLMCDGLSTALFVLGLDGATEYWKAHDGFDVIMITEDGKIYITQGIEDKFSLSQEYEKNEINVITK